MTRRCCVCGDLTAYGATVTVQLNHGAEHPLCDRHHREWLDFVDVLAALARLGGHTVTTTKELSAHADAG